MAAELDSQIRKTIFSILIVGLVAVVIFKLFSLQVIEQSVFTRRSNENFIKKIILKPARGVFFDRNNNLLVSNTNSFTVKIIPAYYNPEYNRLLEKLLKLKKGVLHKILKSRRRFGNFTPVRIKKDVPFPFISWYEENSSKLKGIKYSVELQRDYSFGVNGSHFFGYLGNVSLKQLKKFKGLYSAEDLIGIIGLEKQYEKYLRGKKGYKLTVVNAQGKIIKHYKNGALDLPPQKGKDLLLTIDKKTQIIAESLMKGKRGAVVALDPNNGEILAFVSSPQYDLSKFAGVTSPLVLDSLTENKDKPLFNRATLSLNPPGSTIKMLDAIALLQENIISTANIVNCKGGLQFGNRFFKCTHIHGRVNVVEAIEKSCNTFFYYYVQKLGLQKLARYARMFGFGSKTGVDIGEEASGLVPDEDYYNRIYGLNKWSRGVLLSLAIGQGEWGVTPIQLAQYVALLANWGKTVRPHFVKAIVDSRLNEKVFLNYDSIKVDVKRKYLDIVRKGMFYVVNRKGTAVNIALPDLQIAGKTGTAQNPHGKDHAVFVAFAPYEKPKIAVAVFIENVGYGATYAAPIAQKIIETYLHYEPKNSMVKSNEN